MGAGYNAPIVKSNHNIIYTKRASNRLPRGKKLTSRQVQALRSYLDKKNSTLAKLAVLIGVTDTTLGRALRGNPIEKENVELISRFLEGNRAAA